VSVFVERLHRRRGRGRGITCEALRVREGV
jgi:hypothetical protein